MTSPSQAQTSKWPDKPVRIVVPFAPGGSNDVIARRLADSLRQSLGQPFLIENKPGAGSVVGANYVAQAAPDAYTILFVSGSLATTAGVQKTPYDAKSAFEPIATVAESPFVLLIRENLPVKNLKELIAYVKANSGKVNYGTAGIGDNAQLMTELLAKEVGGLKMQSIAYKGISPAQLDLVAGRIDFLFTTMASIKGTAADALPKIAFTGATRDPSFPNIPTVKEQLGLDYVVTIWWGAFGPAGMDKKARDILNAEIKKIVQTPAFEKFLETLGARPMISTPDELRVLLATDVDRWNATAEAIG
ncbi:MAG: tripartite tricarboxylate transporter substrate binding protein, partial [Burkholderiales bacterium]|nr:tripartite tricarboxylate transporter substrate binding protein [Burkholderiales bacterium]